MAFTTNLTDAQWQLIQPYFAKQTFRKHHPRLIVDALLYLVKTGCQWRMLPECFPCWKTVYYHFRRWSAQGVIHRVNEHLLRAARRHAGREPYPSTAIIDSQSVPTTTVGGERGFDGGKRVKGRKRHIITDTLGLVLAVLVHSAQLHDSQVAPFVLRRLRGRMPRLRRIYADQGYRGTPAGLVWRCFGWAWRIVSRRPGQRGFAVLEKRWIVGRTFAWMGGCRRLTRDYEYLPEVSEAMVLLYSIRLMLRRLA